MVQMPVSGVVRDAFLNAVIPVVVYKLSRRYVSPSEFTALGLATTFPLGKGIFDLVRRREANPVSIVVLLGILANGIAIVFGGSARLLLVRESLFTGAFGLACLLSLLLPRPLMFYFGRHFMAGSDPERLARYNAAWQLPGVRSSQRLISLVWGAVFLGELLLRVVLIDNLSTASVLLVSPILLGSLTVLTILWTFRYARGVRMRALARLEQLPSTSAR
jgi:hypothetical protein